MLGAPTILQDPALVIQCRVEVAVNHPARTAPLFAAAAFALLTLAPAAARAATGVCDANPPASTQASRGW